MSVFSLVVCEGGADPANKPVPVGDEDRVDINRLGEDVYRSVDCNLDQSWIQGSRFLIKES